MTNAQVDRTSGTFGNGLRVVAKDSTFYVQFRLRIQPNFTGTYVDATNSFQEDWSIRRCRAKLDGWAFSPKLVYKLEYDLAGNYIRDAVIKWNFARKIPPLVRAGKTSGKYPTHYVFADHATGGPFDDEQTAEPGSRNGRATAPRMHAWEYAN